MNWAPVAIKALVESEAGAYLSARAGRIKMEGPEVALDPKAFATLALVAISIYARQLGAHERLSRYGLALILGGAFGNLIDRAVAGYVVDFVDVYWGSTHFWAFNVADSAITIGAALMAIELFLAPQEREAVEPISGDDFVKPDSPV